jgi:hypothetical protein
MNLKQVGRHLPRPRFQRGELHEFISKRGNRPQQKLAHGRYWARWRVYVKRDGVERVRRAEKIIDRVTAEQIGLTLGYARPLTKTDAWKILAKLIEKSHDQKRQSIPR